MATNINDSCGLRLEREDLSIRATRGLNALEHLIVTSSDLEALQSEELAALMGIVFDDVRRALAMRAAWAPPETSEPGNVTKLPCR
ncbi:MAG TPA: hypothetical protein VFW22_16440 [Pseudolabrys sp.]|nr:hypothetical protein [Pseudolabrys sp.]